MAFIHGKDTVVLLGKDNVTSYFHEHSAAVEVEMHDSTVYGKSAKTYVAGLIDGTVSLGGLWDGAASAIDSILSALIGAAASVLTIGLNGTTVGNRATLASPLETSYEIDDSVSELVGISFEGQSDDRVETGLFLHNLVAETVTGIAVSQDNGGASAAGAVGHLHLTAVSGTTPTMTVFLEHSTNNTTWATLLTFTALAGTTTSERKTVTGTVNRYLRASWTITGTAPSYTFAVACARR